MEAAILICPVCDFAMDTSTLSTTILQTPRGKQPWAKCPECRSFFAAEGYDPDREVEHTRTRPWGIVESGIAWTRDKAAMFEAILRRSREIRAKRMLAPRHRLFLWRLSANRHTRRDTRSAALTSCRRLSSTFAARASHATVPNPSATWTSPTTLRG